MYFFVCQISLFAEALYALQGRDSLSSVVPYVFFRLPISLFAEALYDLQGRESLSRSLSSRPTCTSAVSTARNLLSITTITNTSTYNTSTNNTSITSIYNTTTSTSPVSVILLSHQARTLGVNLQQEKNQLQVMKR
jgi:hypothetical protein